MEIVSREVANMSPVVTVERVKANLRLQDSSFDEIIAEYIASATASAEQLTGVVLNTSIFTITGTYEGAYRMPIAPINEVTAKCGDEEVECKLNGGVLTLPSECLGRQVIIQVNAGYPEAPADVRMAIILKASALFLNPVDSADSYTKASDNILKNYRIWR